MREKQLQLMQARAELYAKQNEIARLDYQEQKTLREELKNA